TEAEPAAERHGEGSGGPDGGRGRGWRRSGGEERRWLGAESHWRGVRVCGTPRRRLFGPGGSPLRAPRGSVVRRSRGKTQYPNPCHENSRPPRANFGPPRRLAPDWLIVEAPPGRGAGWGGRGVGGATTDPRHGWRTDWIDVHGGTRPV